MKWADLWSKYQVATKVIGLIIKTHTFRKSLLSEIVLPKNTQAKRETWKQEHIGQERRLTQSALLSLLKKMFPAPGHTATDHTGQK